MEWVGVIVRLIILLLAMIGAVTLIDIVVFYAKKKRKDRQNEADGES